MSFAQTDRSSSHDVIATIVTESSDTSKVESMTIIVYFLKTYPFLKSIETYKNWRLVALTILWGRHAEYIDSIVI